MRPARTARSIFVALVDQILDSLTGAQAEMVLLAERAHGVHRLAAAFLFLFAQSRLLADDRFEGAFHDFFGGAAEAAGDGDFNELLAMGREVDLHGRRIARQKRPITAIIGRKFYPSSHAGQRKRDTLEAFVDRGGPVKLAFFGGLNTLGRIEDPRRAAGSRVQVASLVDLAGMKMRVIQVRGSWKDYVDLHTLAVNGVDVATGLAAAKAIDRNFDPGISIRALQFYGDGTLDRVPAGMQRDLTRWAQAVDLEKLPVLGRKRGLNAAGLER